VPWFVAYIDGKPEFRAADSQKRMLALRDRLCWVCGEQMTQHLVFLLGPMCVINRVTAEPACHRDCAEYSAQACPFLTKPHMCRREGGMPTEGMRDAPGEAILRNPGAVALWGCRRFETFGDGKGGTMISVGPAEWVTWWCEGRTATREEVMASIDSGYPLLMNMARQEGFRAVQALEKMRKAAEFYLPKA
jgi:hypothetical protein